MFIWKLPSPSMSIDQRVGMGRLDTHRGGQTEAHGAQSRAGKPASGSVEVVELGGPHLVLSDAHRDERIAIAGQLRQLIDGVLLQDSVDS